MNNRPKTKYKWKAGFSLKAVVFILFIAISLTFFFVVPKRLSPEIGQHLEGIEEGLTSKKVQNNKNNFICIFDQVRKEKTLIQNKGETGVILVRSYYHRLKRGVSSCKKYIGKIKMKYLLEVNFQKEKSEYKSFLSRFKQYEKNCNDGIYDSLLSLKRAKLSNTKLRTFFSNNLRCTKLVYNSKENSFSSKKTFLKDKSSNIHEEFKIRYNNDYPWLGWITSLYIFQRQSKFKIFEMSADFKYTKKEVQNIQIEGLKIVFKKYSI